MNDRPNKPKRVIPEIIIEDAPSSNARVGADVYYDTLNKLKTTPFSPGMRVLLFLLSLVMAIATIVVLCVALIYTLLAAVSFFQSSNFNAMMRQSWKGVWKFLVFTMGFLLGVFSPAFGIGIVVLYFMVHNEKMDGFFLNKVFTKTS